MRGENGVATLSEQLYASIRADILAGRARPGERLRLAALAERHGVSLSVVREALTRLSGPGERLVSATPQLGFSVTPLSVDELLQRIGTLIAKRNHAVPPAHERVLQPRAAAP